MTHKNVAHDAYYICTTCGLQCQLAGFSIFAEKIWSNRKKMKRDTIDICTVIFLYSGNVNTCCREGALEGRNHFGIRRKKVKAVTADFKFGITEHLHKEFYPGGQKSD